MVAVAHSTAVVTYHLLSRRKLYRELGHNYFDERKHGSVVHRLVRHLGKLGNRVSLETQPPSQHRQCNSRWLFSYQAECGERVLQSKTHSPGSNGRTPILEYLGEQQQA